MWRRAGIPWEGRGHTADLLNCKAISGIAQTYGKSSAQVILRWNLQKGAAVIPGSSNPGHIQENTQLYDFTLTNSEMPGSPPLTGMKNTIGTKGFSMRRRTAGRVFAGGPVPRQLQASSILFGFGPLRGYTPCAPSFEWKFFDNL